MSSHVFDKQAWAKMTMFEQMGNIGSEVGRALSAKQRGDTGSRDSAMYRGLDLIDETSALWAKNYPNRNRELLRARELFVRSVITDDVDESLEGYFMNFAIASRLAR